MAVDILDECIEQPFAVGRGRLGRLDHGQQGAVLVVIFHQPSENCGITPKFGRGGRPDVRGDIGSRRFGFGNGSRLGGLLFGGTSGAGHGAILFARK